MQKRAPERGIFGKAKRAAREVQEAALILGAERPPQDALAAAVDLLWRRAKVLSSGGSEAAITRSVVSLVQELHEVGGDRIYAHAAAVRAAQRYNALRRQSCAGSSPSGDSQDSQERSI